MALLWNLKDGKVFTQHSPSQFKSAYIDTFMRQLSAGQATDQRGVAYLDAYVTRSGFIYAAPRDINERYQKLLPNFGPNQAFSLVTSYASLKQNGTILTNQIAKMTSFREALEAIKRAKA